MNIPNGYLPVMPYLIIEGTHKFIDFMKEVFNAEVQYIEERGEGNVRHSELRIEQAVIMAADPVDEYRPFPGSIFLYVENADTIFQRAMAKGMRQLQELATREYGRGGGFADEFGNHWWVNTPLEK
ncbi:MAG TPA: VOC family protein [Chitinophagaceae bacterium]|nr:VOC family protein [Chitinophagaceae bacterium]